jgi:alkylhydroperoxidase family enzyme
MLRASSEATARPVDLRGIVDVGVDPLLPAARELLAFTDAAVLGDTLEIAPARERLRAVVGDAGLVRAASCAGAFQMMNRVLDAVGSPVRPAERATADSLGLAVPGHLISS